VKRRDFITLLGGAATAFSLLWPLGAHAQPAERVRSVGVLLTYASAGSQRFRPFIDRLQELGWREGHNLRIDQRWSAGDVDRIRGEALDLVGLQPDVIFTGGSAALIALQHATRTIPIVFTNVTDPVGQGFIEGLARPGSNATGFTNFEFAMGGKWLETLKGLVPHAAKVALIVNPHNPNASIFLRSIETAAPSFGIETLATPIRNQAEIERSIRALASAAVSGLIVLPDGLAVAHSQLIIGLVAQHRLPAVYPFRDFVAEGGLVSYGMKLSENYRQAADYVDRILRGANPANLPVQAPTKYETVINLKTAKALGLDVPMHLQQLADEVIE
jgi:putative tryptophan/tyrosine transport system substrate-binding protein